MNYYVDRITKKIVLIQDGNPFVREKGTWIAPSKPIGDTLEPLSGSESEGVERFDFFNDYPDIFDDHGVIIPLHCREQWKAQTLQLTRLNLAEYMDAICAYVAQGESLNTMRVNGDNVLSYLLSLYYQEYGYNLDLEAVVENPDLNWDTINPDCEIRMNPVDRPSGIVSMLNWFYDHDFDSFSMCNPDIGYRRLPAMEMGCACDAKLLAYGSKFDFNRQLSHSAEPAYSNLTIGDAIFDAIDTQAEEGVASCHCELYKHAIADTVRYLSENGFTSKTDGYMIHLDEEFRLSFHPSEQ